MSTQMMTSREIRSNWSDVQRLAERGNTDVIAERNGKPTVAMIGYNLYEVIQPLLDEIRAAMHADDLMKEWVRTPSIGIPHDQFWTEIEDESADEEAL